MPSQTLAQSLKPNIMLSKTTSLESIQGDDQYNKYILKDYLVSEKLDGVRGYWNGQSLLSRTGKVIHAPAWFIKDFPNIKLEGELWTARGQFDLVSGIIRKQTPVDSDWKKVKFMLFDAPDSKLIFSQRLDYIKNQIMPLKLPWLKLIDHKSFTEFSQLKVYYESVINNNGEGIMLNKANAYYQTGRTDNIKKLKPFTDKEAIVVKHLTGKGKYKNMMGSLLVKDKNGREFKIGSGFSDQQRQHPPKIGDIISYRYTGTTKTGLPRFPVFIRVRTDMEEL
jgi:DNA ligase-1